jgi:DNA-binding MarR family transcriptional regulator
MSLTDAFRSFNRFYTREIGLLNRRLPGGDVSLPEARVLYEIGHAPPPGQTAAEIGRTLEVDKARMSRIVARLRDRGWIASRAGPEHARRLRLSLTRPGAATLDELERGACEQIDGLLAPVDARGRARVAQAIGDLRVVLDRRDGQIGPEHAGWRLRPLAPGDVGWIAHRQARTYHEEYGWDWTYEGLACQILGGFVLGFDRAREDARVAERGGAVVGAIFLMKSDDLALAKLRLLHVERSARGIGLGKALVGTCVARARELG